MSKAFTKEDHDGEEPLPPYHAPWPVGTRNYITAAGYARLRAERDELARLAPTFETRRRLAIVAVHLEAAEVVAPVEGHIARVQLGTKVTVEGERTRSYSIVGVDEVDVARGRVSWLSPIAKALLGRAVGDEVQMRAPGGEEQLVVRSIEALAA